VSYQRYAIDGTETLEYVSTCFIDLKHSMNKYVLLGQYLGKQSSRRVPMNFAEIEGVIGAKLPPSAYRHRPWWSNNPSNSVMTKVWLDAGYRTEQVDMEGRNLVFVRTPSLGDHSSSGPSVVDPARAASRAQGSHPLLGALKGTFTIEHGTDLTQPAMPEWGKSIDETHGAEDA